jgi:hypothetical protein
MKPPTLSDFDKQNRAIEKEAAAIKAKMAGSLRGIEDGQEGLIKLYRQFDRIKKSLAKASKGEKEDKAGIAEVEKLLKQGDAIFKQSGADLAAVKKLKPEAKKLEDVAKSLVKDLDVMAGRLGKAKAPDAGKYDALLRHARKTADAVTAELVKHRAKAIDPERDRKDFEKELTQFIVDVKEGKHRQEDDWMKGDLDPSKVADAAKALKKIDEMCVKTLKEIEEKIEEAQSAGHPAEIRGEQKLMAKHLTTIEKLWKAYHKQKFDKNEAKTTDEGRKLLAFLGELDLKRQLLVRRYKLTVAEAAKVK